MEHTAAAPQLRARVPQPVAGVIAGALAGAAYLLAQVSLVALPQGNAAAPLQRIAAILMGPDVAPPPAELDPTIFGMALLIHFGLAVVFGRVVGTVAWTPSFGRAAVAGATVGALLYGLNYELLAPSAFPWFEDAPPLRTLANHLLFGALAGVVCAVLRRQQPPPR